MSDLDCDGIMRLIRKLSLGSCLASTDGDFGHYLLSHSLFHSFTMLPASLSVLEKYG